MTNRSPVTVFLIGVLLLLGASRYSHADDGIFPPAAAAKPYIDFDGRGFLLDGKRIPIISAGTIPQRTRNCVTDVSRNED